MGIDVETMRIQNSKEGIVLEKKVVDSWEQPGALSPTLWMRPSGAWGGALLSSASGLLRHVVPSRSES